MKLLQLAAGIVLCLSGASAGTILTFDLNVISPNILIPQAYGDNVSAASDGAGSYGTDDGTYTPNVTVAHGGLIEEARFFGGLYGNLINVRYAWPPGITTNTTTFTAAGGFLVRLLDFRMGGWPNTDRTVAGISVRDGIGNVLWSQGPTVASGSTSTLVAINGGVGVAAETLELVIDLTGLGVLSEVVGVDDVRFTQEGTGAAVPEPGAAMLLWSGLALLGVRRIVARRSRQESSPIHATSIEGQE